MYISKTLLATIIGTSLILSGCNDGNDSTPTPTPTTVQTEATVSSTKANIAIFGAVDKNFFTETALASNTGVLLLDDTQANAVGFALDLKNNPKTLDELTTQYLSDFTQLLKNNGATVNVLVNKISKNSQSDVAHITLELDFNTAQNVRKIRELLIAHLNGNVALTTLPATVTDQNVKLRLNLAFWIADQTGFLWANSYSINQATVVNKLYGDLNIATALSSNAPIEIKTVSNEFTQNATGSNAVDILWSIDSSGSMGQEQSNLANGATQFFNTLNKAGIDYR